MKDNKLTLDTSKPLKSREEFDALTQETRMSFSKAGGQLYEFAEDKTAFDLIRKNTKQAYDDNELFAIIEAALRRKNQIEPEIKEIIEGGVSKMNPAKWFLLGTTFHAGSHKESRKAAYKIWCEYLVAHGEEPTAPQINQRLAEQGLELSVSNGNKSDPYATTLSRWLIEWRELAGGDVFNIPQC